MPIKKIALIILLFQGLAVTAQLPEISKDTVENKKAYKKLSPFVTGYYPIWFFDVDLRYFIKYNNYESFRLGFGGITNERLFENFKIGGYTAYGFKDDAFKYSLGGNYRLNKKNNAWINLYYTKDIREMGSFEYLTKNRTYSIFEPRLLNITQFYSYRTWKSALQLEPHKKVVSEIRLSHSRIEQIENYQYLDNGIAYENYKLAEVALAVRYSPKTLSLTTEEGIEEFYDGFPKISAQINQGFKDIAGSNFNYTKAGLKLDYYIKRTDLSSSKFVLEGAMAFGDVPLTHLYHAYPNNPTKDEILQRFSVAGTQSFETMYFGEFFSSKLLTFRAKHTLRRFNFSEKFQPELVLITRHAMGEMEQREKHLGLPFNTLENIYSESGFEINKLLFGFGLSFAYRYGFYNLDKFEDNVSVKFTFNLKL